MINYLMMLYGNDYWMDYFDVDQYLTDQYSFEYGY